jgi:8-oxo-dGTP pyrophosphatase MutT (NUDIX family)
MKKAVSSGGIVLRKTGDIFEMLLVFSTYFNSWLIPKGHVKDGETIEEAAVREVLEETGLTDVKMVSKVGIISRKSTELSKEVVDKDIHIFLFRTDSDTSSPKENPEDLTITRWFSIDEGISSLYFEPDREFLIKHKSELKFK